MLTSRPTKSRFILFGLLGMLTCIIAAAALATPGLSRPLVSITRRLAGSVSRDQADQDGMQLLAEIDLDAQTYDNKIIGEFTLAETAVVTIAYSLPNINTPFLDLTLEGPGSAPQTILHSEDFRTDQLGGGSWEQDLSPGHYQILLTSRQTSGTLSLYWKQK